MQRGIHSSLGSRSCSPPLLNFRINIEECVNALFQLRLDLFLAAFQQVQRDVLFASIPQPDRSRTHLLQLTRERFESLERSDPEGCAELSALLCRLAARRCAETAERLARWRIMAGPS